MTSPLARFTYNGRGLVAFITHSFAGGAGNVTLDVARYNPAGQIDTRTRSNDLYAWNGGYDVNRSDTVNGLNQHTAAGGTTFAYDANGNLTRSGSTHHVHDVENRLVAASGGAAPNRPDQGKGGPRQRDIGELNVDSARDRAALQAIRCAQNRSRIRR